jgi:hypothetical protein
MTASSSIMAAGQSANEPLADGDVEFVLVAEAGVLEAQALLLCESIRRFGGRFSSSPITVISPRPARRPASSSVRAYGRLHADYLPIDVDSCCPQYGTSYRVHAAAHAERRIGPAVIVQLDSDTLFLGEPEFALGCYAAAARPVDVKGMCTAGPDDPCDGFWRELCRLAEVAYEEIPQIETSIDRIVIRASYNGGLLVARRECGLFQATENLLKKLVAARLSPWGDNPPTLRTGTGLLGGEGTAYWGTSQAAFSIAAVSGGHAIRILPDPYNIPLHLADRWPLGYPAGVIHVHYHDLFSEQSIHSNPLLNGRLRIADDALAWLKSHVSDRRYL